MKDLFVLHPVKKCVLHNKRTNWSLFRELSDIAFQVSVSLKTKDEITEAVLYFNKSVQDAAWSSTPPPPSRNMDTHVAKHIFDKIIKKRRLRRHWQTTRDPVAKKKLNHANRQLKRTLEKDLNDGVHTYLTGLDATASSDYSLWKATRKLKRPINVAPPIRKSDGTWARTDQEKARTFSEHLSNVFTPHPYDGSPEDAAEITNCLNIPEETQEKVLVTIPTVSNLEAAHIDEFGHLGHRALHTHILARSRGSTVAGGCEGCRMKPPRSRRNTARTLHSASSKLET
ncbi:hypothetical protein HF086_012479 [Spodoptera exigua]|uniref:RNA-directed DNA polymerase from transposon X-element n=1 Tax=Spodoptera exigua TaxID=7107 RepID=A0A922M5P8_SPOEX|nr:hypothetical protein HF086_012479 [Spodoptera exigua]